MHQALFRIWTRDIVSITYDYNKYTTKYRIFFLNQMYKDFNFSWKIGIIIRVFAKGLEVRYDINSRK